MRIRLADIEDIPAIIRIVGDVIPLMHADGNLQWGDTYPLEVHFKDDIDNRYLWVAEDDIHSVIAGFAAITTIQSEEYADAGCDLSALSVIPHRMAIHVSYRRQGVALLLFEKAEDIAKELGFPYVRVDTNSENKALRALILKAGFLLKGEINLSGLGPMKFCCYEKLVEQPC